MAQLIQVSDESHLWSARYDREMTDLFEIQDEISQAIANELKVKLVAPRRGTVNVEAFQNCQKGWYWFKRLTAESLVKAKEAFEQALVHDPGYALAHDGLAQFYFGMGSISVRPMSEMAGLAKSAAQKALAIDPTLREAHSLLGQVAGAVEYNWKAAERHFQAAMADPVPPAVRFRYALFFLVPLQRYEEAIAQYQQVLETDPLAMAVHYGLSLGRYCQGRYDEAMAHAVNAVELFPDYWPAHLALGRALAQKGCLQQSIASVETAVRVAPTVTVASGYLAGLYVRAGERTRAEKVMELVRERKAKHYVSPAYFAFYHAALGDSDKMFEYLQAAQAEGDPNLTHFMNAEPYFQAFRSDPRYQALMKQMNLA